jgi:CHAT domain-containing protein
LVLSPHRTLHLFPFHAAPWQDGAANRYLIERFAVRYVPNLSSLLLPWRGNGQGPVLAVGVAHFDDPNIPTLPNAEAEAAAVAAAHGPNGHALAGATREELAALPLGDYRCLHLATHGSSVLTGDAVDDPMQACLYLRDGALNSWDIAALHLRAELVVLAACHSGQRSIAGRGLDKLPGDDIFGLQAVLFDAGVGAVLGTLWPVEDATALAILLDVHRAYAGGAPPDDALHEAILAHLANPDRRRDVFYWAPFFISALGRKA